MRRPSLYANSEALSLTFDFKGLLAVFCRPANEDAPYIRLFFPNVRINFHASNFITRRLPEAAERLD